MTVYNKTRNDGEPNLLYKIILSDKAHIIIPTHRLLDEYIDVVFKNDKKEEIKRLKEEIKKELDVDKKMKLVQKIAELKEEDVYYERN